MNDEDRSQKETANRDPTTGTSAHYSGVEPTRTLGSPPEPDATLPSSIGPYRILGKLGEGGMGVVYEAEQENPRRKIALKVVRGGQFVDEHRVRMFQREADALARLKHPNIGAIYESGRTEDGQHFFVMELVRGETLEVYLRKRPQHLTRVELRFRLALFRKIADAVHYAHQRGVIHRDLKPSNIIVNEEAAIGEGISTGSGAPGDLKLPEVKILDFGLARITEGDLAAATMTTEIGVIKGTLAYMSPEQARGRSDEIDLRADVYALGMVLYETLSGSRPYDVREKSLVEAVRVICEETPQRLGRTSSGSRSLDVDIETIVGKALEKEADRRYASAAALSEDVGRYLGMQPILARPPSTTYQLRKFAQRNRVLVGGVAATFLVLTAGVITSTTLGLREAAQRREAELARIEAVGARQNAEKEARKATAVSAFLMNMLEEADPIAGDKAGVTVREALDGASREIESGTLDEPEIEAAIRTMIGQTYRELGLYTESESHLREALSIRERLHDGVHTDVLYGRNQLARLFTALGNFDDAEPLLTESCDGYRSLLQNATADDRPELEVRLSHALSDLGTALVNAGKIKQAILIQGELSELDRRVHGETSEFYAIGLYNFSILHDQIGDYDEAERLVTQALDIYGREHGDTSGMSFILDTIGLLLQRKGDWAAAESHHRRALSIREARFGHEHTNTAFTIGNLAQALHLKGDHAQADSLYRRAARMQAATMGDDNPKVAYELNRWARLKQDVGELAEAERMYRQAISIHTASVGRAHHQTATYLHDLATALEKGAELAGAESTYREALAIRRDVLPEGNPSIAESALGLGKLLCRTGRATEGERLLRESWDSSKKRETSPYALPATAEWALGECLTTLTRYGEAEPLLLSAYEGLKTRMGADHPRVSQVAQSLVSLYEAWDREDQAHRYTLEHQPS